MPECTVAALGKLFDLSERRIQQLTNAGALVRLSRGKYDLWPSIKGYTDYLKGQLMAPERELIKENLKLKKMQREKLEGELINAKEMEEGLTKTFTIVRDRIRAVGPKCSRRVYDIKIAKLKKNEAILAIEKVLSFDHEDALNELSLVHARPPAALPIKEPKKLIKKKVPAVKRSTKKKPIKKKKPQAVKKPVKKTRKKN